MKQKIVIKVQMTCDKCRSKAMKHAAVAEGVTSVAIEGAEKDRVVVIGDGVDSACLTGLLRKKVGYATLVSVEEVKAKKEPEEVSCPIQYCSSSYVPCPIQYCSSSYVPCPQYQTYCKVVYDDPNPTGCSIM